MPSGAVTREEFEEFQHIGNDGNEGGPVYEVGETLRYYIYRSRQDPSKDQHVDVRVVTSYLRPTWESFAIWWKRRYLVISLNGRVHDVDRMSLERPE